MVFTLPWGNDEAENYFWQLMQNKGFIELLEDEGLSEAVKQNFVDLYRDGLIYQ